MESTYTGVISKIIYLCPKTGFCVFILSSTNGRKKKELKCVGNRSDLIKGASVVVKGAKETNSYGDQIKCSSIQIRLMESDDTFKSFLTSSYVKGIGPKTADAIIKKFGSDARRILEENPQELLKVKGINEAKLEIIVESYQNTKKFNELFEFLAPAQVTSKTVSKIFEEYGNDAMHILLDNCYRLSLDLDGFGFIKADTVALGIGYKANDPRRVDSAINYVLMSEAESSGDVYIEESVLIKKTTSLTKLHTDEIIKRLNLIVKSESPLAVTCVVHNGLRHYAYQKHRRQEEYIAKTVADLLKSKSDIKTEASPFQMVVDRLAESDITLTDDQFLACKTSLENKISVISGGPGTGKTTISKVIIDTLKEIGADFALLAPTGKATVRASEKSGCQARTVLSFIYKRMKAKYIIVDESSMLNYSTVFRLFKSVPNAHYIFIGDKGQHAPIGVGDFFKTLCELDVVPKVHLTTTMRQAEGSGIIRFVNGILENEINIKSVQTKEDLDNNDAVLVEFKKKETYIEKFPSLYTSLVKKYPNLQVITCRKDGDFGVRNLNRIIREIVNPDLGQASVTTKIYNFRVGDRVIFTKNDIYGVGVANGDTGVIIDLREEVGKFNKFTVAEIKLDHGGIVTYDDLANLELAYALTSHKTQGSEYDAIIFTIFSEAYTLLSKNMVYTSASRPREKLVVFGERKAIKMAISKGDIGSRLSLLGVMIQDLYSKKSDENDNNGVEGIA